MSYFNNDHLQINNLIIDFEENISKISSISQILQSIDNIDEFNDLRSQITNLFKDTDCISDVVDLAQAPISGGNKRTSPQSK